MRAVKLGEKLAVVKALCWVGNWVVGMAESWAENLVALKVAMTVSKLAEHLVELWVAGKAALWD
jgi:hypothetical protein